jgi:hypothetical protein
MRGDEVDAIDRATTQLYEQVRASARHAEFVHRIESNEPLKVEGPPPRIVLMPGAFHGQYEHTGADGRRVFELAQDLNWPAEKVPVPTLGSMAGNAALLVDALARHRGEPMIVVSLSKSGADVRAALDRPEAARELRDVRAWVNLSGIVTGTPLVAWLRARPLRCLGVRVLLRLRRQRFAEIEELRHGPGSPLANPLVLPATMRAIHVIGFPHVRDLSNDWARRAHARLAPLGPSDGGGILLRDILDLPGHVYPVRGCDHYLQPPWDVRPLLRRILLDAARASSAAEGAPQLPQRENRVTG